jgi:replicative DNA helicase
MIDLYHIESEQSVLGGLLIDPNAFDRLDFLKESDFYREDHRLIWRAISMMLAERKPVDVITVAERLKSSGVDEQHAGLAYLGDLQMNTPTSANIVRYAEVVREKRLLRDLMVAAESISRLATADSMQPAVERIDEAQALIYALSESADLGDGDAVTIGAVLAKVVESVQARFDSDGDTAGLSSGLTDLDAKTNGFAPGDLVVIAGRPSMGKTALALNIAEQAATEHDKAVVVFSMEMQAEQLGMRSVSSVGLVSLQALRTGKMSDDDFSRMSHAVGKLYKSKLVIDDRGGLSVMQMRSRCRRVARKYGGVDLVVVDYIQLATANLGKGASREQEVSAISRGLKGLAKEFNCPVIALSQISRKVEDRTDKRPLMSDLRESGAIEQDADLILMMYRDDYYNKDSAFKGIAEIVIGKQRMGETGTVPVLFRGEYSRFENLTADAKRALHEARQISKPMARKQRGFDG